jgi:hypothetical protein
MDDLPVHGTLPPGETRLSVAQKILAAFKAAGVPEVYGFVNGYQLEREPGSEDALSAYASALAAWPGALAPVVALARLRVLSGAADAGRATLAGLHIERDMRERSDPWLGYVGGQGWRVQRHAGNGMGGIADHLAGYGVEARDIDDRIHHGDIVGADIRGDIA